MRVTPMTEPRRLSTDQSGVAIMEFALVLPIFVFAVFGGLELAWNAVQQQRVERIAAIAADNAARVRGAIDETNIYEIIAATDANNPAMDFETQGRMIISSIQNNETGNGQWIRWQRCYGSKSTTSAYGVQGAGKRDASIKGLGMNKTMKAPPGSAVIVVEVAYDHQPLITNNFFGKKEFRFETAYVLRDRTDLTIGNTTGLKSSKIMTC